MRFKIVPKRLTKESKQAYLIVVSAIFGGVLSNAFIKIPELGLKGIVVFFFLLAVTYYFLNMAIKENR
ncbi:MAG: hypothetical protein AABX53_01140 [Nanoarchaeota archaeon]